MKTESKIKSKTMFPLSNKQETEEIMQFCSELSEDEQRELLNFIRGARFAKSLQQKTAQEVGMQKDFNRLRTGFVGACAALALMQGCVNDVKYVKLHQEYQHHLKVEAEFLQDLVLILQSGHLDSDQIVSKFEQEIQQQILNIGHHSDLGKMKFRSL